jgi:hypothetical protein
MPRQPSVPNFMGFGLLIYITPYVPLPLGIFEVKGEEMEEGRPF